MTKAEQAHLDKAYVNIKAALDEMLQVVNKDKLLIRMQGTLYRMEDTLYQYISNPTRRAQ